MESLHNTFRIKTGKTLKCLSLIYSFLIKQAGSLPNRYFLSINQELKSYGDFPVLMRLIEENTQY